MVLVGAPVSGFQFTDHMCGIEVVRIGGETRRRRSFHSGSTIPGW
jgi:hypothetical protein